MDLETFKNEHNDFIWYMVERLNATYNSTVSFLYQRILTIVEETGESFESVVSQMILSN